ncbi:MAG: hypothetical protein DSY82_08045 [Flavobacteriia bacterium]|nr:MAG: hypothetical protein DSY82_08045 [Flavobacteriia bacterium]
MSLVACDQEETLITPSLKESVEFDVVNPEFEVVDALKSENIKNVAEDADFNGNVNVNLNDIWIEVKINNSNQADIARLNLSMMADGNEVSLLNEDAFVALENKVTIVPLVKILSEEGRMELMNKLNNITAGTDETDIEMTLSGETFFNEGMSGSVDLDMEMFIRYSF